MEEKKGRWFSRKKPNKPQQNNPSQPKAEQQKPQPQHKPAQNQSHSTQQKRQNPSHPKKPGFGQRIKGNFEKKMRIIPLGGLEEVGKNIMAIEYGNDIIVIDVGMSFAGPEHLGVDYIVPDVTWLEERKHKIRGVIFTHGHLDHIGAIHHILPKLGNPPMYATKLAAGLVMNRLREFALDKTCKLHEYNEDTKLKLGAFEIEFFNVNHSVPEGKGVYVKTPAGSLVHTGDFKFDHSPAIDKPADFQRIAEVGKKGVDVLLIDSTNASKPGWCKSEAEVAKTLQGIIENTKGRLIIASFSSLIGRVNQICGFAAKNGRKVFLSGRSMVDNMKLAQKLHYATFPKGSVTKIGPKINSMPPNKVLIMTTGAQGESLSALTRMSLGEHRHVKIKPGDTVVMSASPIPGNEMAIVSVINNLYALGAKVITNGQMDVHTSGHAHQEELKLMYQLIKPRCYVPIHGELFMRIRHGEMIKTIAEPNLQVNVLENNGEILEIGKNGIRKSKQKIPANDILVDGLGFGNLGSKVLHERKIMAEDGVLVLVFRAYDKTRNLIGEPSMISRGFVYMKESEAVAQETKQVAKKTFEKITQQNRKIPLKELKTELERSIGHFIRKRLRREPMIIPVVDYI